MSLRMVVRVALAIVLLALLVERWPGGGSEAAQETLQPIAQVSSDGPAAWQETRLASSHPSVYVTLFITTAAYPCLGCVAYKEGDRLTWMRVDLRLDNPNTQPLDGIQVKLDYDPSCLTVVGGQGQTTPVTQISLGDNTFPQVLQNKVDQGHIDVALGRQIGTGGSTSNAHLATVYFYLTYAGNLPYTCTVRSSATWPRTTTAVAGGLRVPHVAAGADIRLVPSPAIEPAPAGTESNWSRTVETSRGQVNTLTGSFLYGRTDLVIPGRGPSPTFTRSYSSNDSRVGPLGPGWTHSYQVRLNNPGDGSQDLVLVTAEGRSDRYLRNPNGSYTPPAGISTALVKNGDYTYTASHQDQSTWSFSSTGRLTVLKDRHGNQATLTYNGAGQLFLVSDPAGRGSLSFSYDCPGARLCRVTDWMTPARVLQFEYDGSGRLQRVIDREGKVTTYGYEGTSHRLTTITDANGWTAVSNTYDPQGRVQTQKDARGVMTGQQTAFSYVTNPDGTRTTTATYPVRSEASWMEGLTCYPQGDARPPNPPLRLRRHPGRHPPPA